MGCRGTLCLSAAAPGASDSSILGIVLGGRTLKYLVMAYVAAHAPHALRFFGVAPSLFAMAQARLHPPHRAKALHPFTAPRPCTPLTVPRPCTPFTVSLFAMVQAAAGNGNAGGDGSAGGASR